MAASRLPFRWQVGFDTDIGGGRENQDDCFVWSNIVEEICVLCVLDGHGREVGKVAANAAKKSLVEYFEINYMELKTTPYDCLVNAHEIAHQAIKRTFKSELESQGFLVEETEEGYLLRKKGSQLWSCVHGGSSCSICVLVGGLLYIANVGDSSGILCSINSIYSKGDVTLVADAAIIGSSSGTSISDTSSPIVDDMEKSNTLVITAEHSPESVSEFIRLRNFRHRDGDVKQPALNVVYDSPSHEKAQCPPVFILGEGNSPTITNKGRFVYFKS